MFRRRHFSFPSQLFLSSTALRFCSSSSSSSPSDEHDLTSKVQTLSETVNRHQIALASMAKKIVAHTSTNNTNAQQNNNVIKDHEENMKVLKDQVTALSQSFEVLQNQVNSIEDRLSNFEKMNSSTTASHSSSSPTSSSKQISEIMARLSAIESKQAIIRITDKRQSSDHNNNNNNNNKDNSNNDNHQRRLLVSLEPGVDGTPRLSTCQVRVYHATATVTEIRQAMEAAGQVVSCMRKPGERNNNNQANKAKNNNNNNNHLPCYIVTFTSTVDAVRAIENISGMSVGKGRERLKVEPHVLPEQVLGDGGAGAASDDIDEDSRAEMKHEYQHQSRSYGKEIDNTKSKSSVATVATASAATAATATMMNDPKKAGFAHQEIEEEEDPSVQEEIHVDNDASALHDNVDDEEAVANEKPQTGFSSAVSSMTTKQQEDDDDIGDDLF